MHAVVVEREANQQRIHPQHVLEVGDDRNRAARTDRDSLLAPLGSERLTRPVQRRIVERSWIGGALVWLPNST